MKKEHILEEIRRTTAANGGVPFGSRRFFQETGIKVADWKGKLWARWGDALREAGLEPNQLQAAYDENFLIEKLIGLMRELGRFPVEAEIRLKKVSEPSFPNDKTYRSRYKSKKELASKIRDYCQGRAGYEDVLDMCALVPDREDGHEQIAPDDESKEGFGFVYLMKSGKFYKIGKSNAAGRREYEIAIQLPEKLKTVHAIRTDDSTGIEAYWHNRFAAKRKGGEWFDLDASDVAAFKRRKFM